MKLVIKSLIISIPFAILCGCGLMGPTYKKPLIPTPTHFRSDSTGVLVESGVNFSDTSWWARFNSLTLNSLIDDALKHNNNIQMAVGNIAIAQAQLKRVNMSWIPTISLGGTAGVGQANYNSGVQNSFNFYSAGLVPNYSLNILKQIKQGDLAKDNLEKQRYAKDATRLAVISQIVGGYFTLLAIHEQIAQQQKLILDLTEIVELTQIQYKRGYVALTDIQQYQEQLEQAKIQLPALEHNKTVIENTLSVLLNRSLGKITQDNKFADIDINGIIPINLPSSVLRNRPDIMQAEAELKIANADIGVATANFFPSINITTPIGLLNTNYSSLFNPSGDFWVAQITAIMPILDLGLYALLKEKKAQYYVAYYNYIQTVKLAFADVDNNFSNYNTLVKMAISAKSLYEVANSNAKLNQKSYQLGYLSYMDTVSSRLVLDNAQLNLTQVKLQQLQALVNLYQALAGGYNYNNSDKLNKFGDERDL